MAYWVIGHGMFWTKQFFSQMASEYQPSQDFQLEGYADPELDISHITSTETDLDASSVSTEIQVRTLLDVFDQINFTDPNQPAHFSESARMSYGKVYSAESASISYSLWRRVTYIEIPRVASDMCSNKIFKVVFSIAGGLIIVLCTEKALEILGGAFITKGLPALAQHLPQRYNRLLNSTVTILMRLDVKACSEEYNNFRAILTLLTAFDLLRSMNKIAMFLLNVSKQEQKRRRVHLENGYISLAS